MDLLGRETPCESGSRMCIDGDWHPAQHSSRRPPGGPTIGTQVGRVSLEKLLAGTALRLRDASSTSAGPH
jgi:hypothetical protein